MTVAPTFYDLGSSDDEDADALNPSSAKVSSMDLEEDDDVVIIDEPEVMRDKPKPVRGLSDDDECCILDADPGAVRVTRAASPLDSDELVMTGEKGPVACRDFPHARYLCVHFPFKTTSHAKFCAQCHCYVCDSLAPCTFWGDGSGFKDHCHASEESRWKTLRKLAKHGPVVSQAAAIAAPPPLPNVNGMGSPRLDTASASPTGMSRSVGSGLPRLGVKKDSLVVKAKFKGRVRTSQTPHLGVRSPRPHSGRTSAVPPPRTPPAPRDEVPPPGAQFPRFASSPSPGPGGAGSWTQHHPPQPVYKKRGDAAQVEFPLASATPYFSAPPAPPPAPMPSYYPAPAPPPLPTTPPPYIPPPPSNSYTYLPPGAYEYPPPGVFDPSSARLPGTEAQVPASRYVSASAQQVDFNVHTAAFYDYLAQASRSPVDSAAYPGGSADATEGWAEVAAGNFDSLSSGTTIGTAPGHDHQYAASSLNDVLQQMAADDYLWEQNPCWFSEFNMRG